MYWHNQCSASTFALNGRRRRSRKKVSERAHDASVATHSIERKSWDQMQSHSLNIVESDAISQLDKYPNGAPAQKMPNPVARVRAYK